MQEQRRWMRMWLWGACAAAVLAGVGAGPLTGAQRGRAHDARGVPRFSLAAISRPSATRRVLELSGRSGSVHLTGGDTSGDGISATGVRRVGDRLLISGTASDDTVIVDFGHGNPVPPGGLVYTGAGHRTRVGNVLVIRGGHFRRDEYDFASASAGSIHLDRTTISYRELQPVANTGTAGDAVFDLPPGTNNQAALQDDGTPGNNRSELFSGAHTFETTTFTNPSSSLTIRGGGATDTLTLHPADSFSAANVTVGSEGAVTADSLTTTGALRITAGSVDQQGGSLRVGALGANTTTGILLTRPANAIGTFAGSVSGAGSSVSVVSSALSVGTVQASGSFAGADGVTTNNGDLSLLASGKSLELSRTLSAGTGKLTATCGSSGTSCTIDASGGSLSGSPVTLSGGTGTNTFDVTDEDTTGTGPLVIDGGGTGSAAVERSSVSQSSDSGLVLANLASATVSGGNFTGNAKEGILVENTAAATIGGAGAGQPNVIAGNGTNGVTVSSASGIQIVRNSIFGNRGLGISLQDGANHGQSAPTVSAAAPSGSSTHATGSLHSTPGHTFRLEFFDNPACDGSGFAAGQTFIGSAELATDPAGNASFDVVVPGPSAAGDAIGATATDQASGDTSQFSQCIQPSPPSVSIASPVPGASYKLGQAVHASFSCTEGTRGPGIAACFATGNDGPDADTRTAGPHTLTVTAVSRDGMTANAAVSYAVVKPPPNAFTLFRKKLKTVSGVVSFDISVPGPGSVQAVETMLSAGRQFVSGRAHVASRRRQTLHVTIKPNGRGLRLVRHHKRLVSIQLVVTFTPVGGGPHSVRFTLALPVSTSSPLSAGLDLAHSGRS